MKKILFSPVGGTDPIANCRDGALLHIIRNYRPDKVYVFMSKETVEFEEKDKRYSFCLDKIKEFLNIETEFIYMKRPELVQVQLFDEMLTCFREILEDIYEDDCRFLLNVSSGSPAMKSALQVLSAMFEKPMIPIQVSNPTRKISYAIEDRKEYDPELQWECNEDNCEDFENRCTVSSVVNMTVEIKKNLIKRHIESYNYVAAYEIAEPLKEFIDERILLLIEAGMARLKLDKSTCSKAAKKANYDIFPIKQSDHWNVFESLMILKIKIIKEEYADFLRAFSPLFFVLMEMAIEQCPDFDLSEYVILKQKRKSKTPIKQWNKEATATNPVFKSINGYVNRDTVILSDHYAKLIERKELGIADNIKKLTKEIRKAEKDIRNPAAHTITYITDEVIKNCTGMSAEQIFNKLKELCRAVGVKIGKEDLLTYDKLNEEIKKYC